MLYCSINFACKKALERLEKTIKYAHEIGKKVYVTLNIFAWDEKYEEIIEMAKKLEVLKPDGIIAADGGVIEVLKEYGLAK